MTDRESPLVTDDELVRALAEEPLEGSGLEEGLWLLEEPDLEEVERRLGTTFKDPGLLRQALVHKSLTNELGLSGLASNERLEFLGDAVLGAVVAEQLYLRFPDHDEGQLTLLRSSMVRASTLADWARALDLGAFVLVGRGESRAGGRDRDPLLARTFEAVLGAMYLDRGHRAVRKLVRRFVRQEIARAADRPLLDAKSRLQQVSQALYGAAPMYEVIEVGGLGHSPVFTIQVSAGPSIRAVAQSCSKRGAQQKAAAEALAMLESITLPPEETAALIRPRPAKRTRSAQRTRSVKRVRGDV
ncbi:MAG TPA: ribonuclease III [Chloroflexota bacterium]|nr:ribonuclease III [Chloroflexota bacterium]